MESLWVENPNDSDLSLNEELSLFFAEGFWFDFFAVDIMDCRADFGYFEEESIKLVCFLPELPLFICLRYVFNLNFICSYYFWMSIAF